MDTFFSWLGRQADRRDDVGILARFVIKDRAFPRETSRLGIILARYQGMPEQRASAKKAHREWRKLRRVAA